MADTLKTVIDSATLHARVPAELQVRSAIPSGGFLTLDP